MKKTNKSNISTKEVVAIGAGVAALAAATYYFFGPEGQKHRKTVKGWMIKMKGEIVDKMEDAKDVTESVYNQIVDSVAKNYLKGGKATVSDVTAFVDSLKKQWRAISKTTTPKKKASKMATVKHSKKAVVTK